MRDRYRIKVIGDRVNYNSIFLIDENIEKITLFENQQKSRVISTYSYLTGLIDRVPLGKVIEDHAYELVQEVNGIGDIQLNYLITDMLDMPYIETNIFYGIVPELEQLTYPDMYIYKFSDIFTCKFSANHRINKPIADLIYKVYKIANGDTDYSDYVRSKEMYDTKY